MMLLSPFLRYYWRYKLIRDNSNNQVNGNRGELAQVGNVPSKHISCGDITAEVGEERRENATPDNM